VRKVAALIVLSLFVASAVSAQALTAAERKQAVQHLKKSQGFFLKSINEVSDAQWYWKPAPERWSLAECAEHIALSEDLIYQLITERILKSPAAPERKPEVSGKDDAVLKKIPDRSQRFQAPEMIQPKRTFATREALIKHFKASRAKTIALVKSSQADLRSHFFEHPVMKLLDAYQWVLLTSAHSERHTHQIEEVKATAGYPAK
jgi:uncharacterized damage-inducible protein DinB